jgi:DNA-binding NarL/FixJ family response regulator
MKLPFTNAGSIGVPIGVFSTIAPVRVMLIDDDDDDASLTRSLLARVADVKYDIDWVSTFDDGLNSIANAEHDVFLIDHQLGGATGIDLVREAREAGSHAALVMLTGQRDRATDIAAMDAGATDFLLKGRTDAALLDRTLRYAVSQAAMLSALDRSRNQMAGLEELGQLLVDHGPTPATFNRIVNVIVDRFSLRQVAIYVADGEMLHLAAQRGYENPLATLNRGDSSVERVAHAGQPIFLPSVNHQTGELGVGNEIATELSVPLLVAGELMGILNVGSRVASPIGQGEYAAIRLVGDRMTAALELLRERRVAEDRLADARHQIRALEAMLAMAQRGGSITAVA